MAVRWHDYTYPGEYLAYNAKLWDFYNRHHEKLRRIRQRFFKELVDPGYIAKVMKGINYDPDSMAETGFINKMYKDVDCPGMFYFAPQREARPDILICSNHAIIPEMRLVAMNDWVTLIAEDLLNDIQWRYDELNFQVMEAMAQGPLNQERARDILGFLRPGGKFPEYYYSTGEEEPLPIEGRLTLCELKEKKLESQYGYYSDQWVG